MNSNVATSSAWVLLQMLDVIGEILELPAWGAKVIRAMLVAGFFVTYTPL
jgi:hypothetical protein